MPTVKNILIALVSVAFGIVTFIKVFSSSKYLEPFIDPCMSGKATHKFVGVKGRNLDKFLCVITPFYEGLVLQTEPIGFPSFLFVSQTFIALAIYSTIESIRKNAKGFVYLGSVVFLVGQAISISAAFPSMFMTSLILHSDKKADIIQDKFLSSNIVFISALCNLGIVFSGAALFWVHPYFYESIALFQFIPALMAIPVLIVRSQGYPNNRKTGLQGSNAAQNVYLFFALVCSVMWLLLINIVIKERITADAFLSISAQNVKSTALFLVLDGMSLSTSAGFLVLFLNGFGSLVQFLVLSVLIGPGAAFLLSAYSREKQLSKELERLEQTELKKKKK